MLLIILWVWDYLIILTYIVSTLLSLLLFYYLKLILLKDLSSDFTEHIEGQESDERSEGKGTKAFFWFILILLILATPLIALFLIPDLWLVLLNGFASGASLSEVILYLRKGK